MTPRQEDVLRIQPYMASAMRAHIGAAINSINATVATLNQHGYLAEPWLGDETSGVVAAHYAAQAMEGTESAYRSLVAYRDELVRVHDALENVEDNYHRTERDMANRFGRMT
jgi:uncharacterized protein YukE